jgi:myo-inositol 2-dehydrogenase/D-chiro-inositol 1-dehydrogenase
MKIGLAGVGRIGTMHAEVLAANPSVTELVLYDVAADRCTEVAGRFGATAVSDLDTFLAADLDGLVIATATGSHADLIRRAVAYEIPVFCEKPVAIDRNQTEAVRELVEASGVQVQVGFHRRFDAGYLAARAALAGGDLGELRRVHLVSADPAPPPESFIRTSGGIFRDLLIHDFDILRFVTGREVASVYAIGANRGAAFFGEAQDVDEVTTLLVLDDDTLVTAHASRYNGAGYDIRMELAGTEGTTVVGLAEHSPLSSAEPGVTFPRGPVWQVFSDRFKGAYAEEIRAFIDVAAGQRESPCTVHEALHAANIAEAADLSLHEHRLVNLHELTAQEGAHK